MSIYLSIYLSIYIYIYIYTSTCVYIIYTAELHSDRVICYYNYMFVLSKLIINCCFISCLNKP